MSKPVPKHPGHTKERMSLIVFFCVYSSEQRNGVKKQGIKEVQQNYSISIRRKQTTKEKKMLGEMRYNDGKLLPMSILNRRDADSTATFTAVVPP